MHNIDIDRLRCIDDNIKEYEGVLVRAEHNAHEHKIQLLSNSLKVTAEITPRIFSVIERILNQLSLLDISLECYVHNDSDMNASCFSLDNDVNVIIIISSGLVNKMTENELAFVIGHELGHYIFGHLNYAEVQREKNELVDMKLSRIYQAHEISADRIGLICSGSIESSLRAIVKTVSGLNDEFITHNLYTYLHRIQSLKYDELAHAYHTHPIFPIRAKALTLFSMSELYYLWIKEEKKAPLTTSSLTKRIRKDLESTTLKGLKVKSQHIVSKFKLWFYVKSFIEDNTLDNDEVTFLEKHFGPEMTKKAITFAQNNSNGVAKKYEDFRKQVHYLPSFYRQRLINEMKDSLEGVLSQHDVQKYFKNLKKSILDAS